MNQPSIEMQSGSPDMIEVKRRILRMFCVLFAAIEIGQLSSHFPARTLTAELWNN